MKKSIKIYSITIVLFLLNYITYSQATRTWVSGVGDDANPCSRTAPCKTFAGAISKTAAAGEINVLDPGGFGGVTITKSITITSEGFEAGVLVSGTNAIIINTTNATDQVILRGLDFEGLGTGLSGINILNAESVLIEKCTINAFNTAGISVVPSSNPVKVIVQNSRISNCTTAVNVSPSGSVVADVNLLGILIGMNVTGLNSTGTGAIVRLSDSAITNNTTGITNSTGKIFSFGDNIIAGNTNDNAILVQSKQ
jgi:hypothetical protein